MVDIVYRFININNYPPLSDFRVFTYMENYNDIFNRTHKMICIYFILNKHCPFLFSIFSNKIRSFLHKLKVFYF